jgi:glycosyltransferase involved in cell wall biosynthesis
VGYVGGSDPRKGYPHLEQLHGEPNVALLLAGPGSERIRIGGRPGIGFVDIDRFYAACDVVAAPAVFDSAPVAVLQAAARDVPIVTTKRSGWASAIQRTGAGVVWDPSSPLIAAIHAAATTSTADRRRFLAVFGEDRQRATLVDAYEHVLDAA